MKRLFVLALCLCSLFVCVACSSDKKDEQNSALSDNEIEYKTAKEVSSDNEYRYPIREVKNENEFHYPILVVPNTDNTSTDNNGN